MIEDELIQIWQTSPLREQIKFEKSKLMLEVQSSLNRFNRAVNRRDLIEIGAAIFFVIPAFTYEAYRQPNLVAKFGAIWIVVYCIYVVFRLLKAKKAKPNENSTYYEYLEQFRAYLINQKVLLDNVLFWYILPGLFGALIMLSGMMDLFHKPWIEIIGTKKLWIAITVFTAIGLFIHLLNKWAVKKEIVPRLKKVNELIRLMQDR